MTRKPNPMTDKSGEVRELTREEIKKMKPAQEVVPGIVARAKRRGRPPSERPKEQVTLRLDPEIIEYFKTDGAGWQTRLNSALSRYVRRARRMSD